MSDLSNRNVTVSAASLQMIELRLMFLHDVLREADSPNFVEGLSFILGDIANDVNRLHGEDDLPEDQRAEVQ